MPRATNAVARRKRRKKTLAQAKGWEVCVVATPDALKWIDIPRLAPQLPGEPVPMYVELTSSLPPEPTPYPQPLTLPELGNGSHLSYAVQWFIFAACVAVGWVLAVRHSLSTLRADAAAARRADVKRPAPAAPSA